MDEATVQQDIIALSAKKWQWMSDCDMPALTALFRCIAGSQPLLGTPVIYRVLTAGTRPSAMDRRFFRSDRPRDPGKRDDGGQAIT